MGRSNGGDGLPPCKRHRAAGGVLKGRHAEERSRSAGAAGGLEGLRPESVLVQRQPSKLKVKQARQGLDPRIGHGFGQDQVSGPRNGREHDRRRVLGTAGDHHPVGIGLEPTPRHPPGACSPVARHPGGGLIEIHQPVEIRTAGQSLE